MSRHGSLIWICIFLLSLPLLAKNLLPNKFEGEAPLNISFQVDPIPQATYYVWTFGDGESVLTTSPSVSHTFRRPGVYKTELDYADSKHKKLRTGDNVRITVREILNSPPIAVISCETQNLVVSCNGLGSTDLENQALTYQFNFGDGTVVSSSTGAATHAYVSPGTFTVTLKVTDTLGSFGTNSVSVSPENPPNDLPLPVLNCISVRPYTLDCNAVGSSDPDGSIVSYLYTWSAGETTTLSSTGNVTHRYGDSLPKEVSLEVTDNVGAKNDYSNI